MSIYKIPDNLQTFHSTKNLSGSTEIKIAVIGDSGCGKTSLLLNFQKGEVPSYADYIPTVFDHYNSYVTNGLTTYKLVLHDTAGQEDYEGLRTLLYKDIDLVIACYEIDLLDSLANIKEYWLPEVRRYKADMPIVLVGTKIDLKNDLIADQLVNSVQEQQIAKEIGDDNLVGHLQTSSIRSENVKKTFDFCIAGHINKLASKSTFDYPGASDIKDNTTRMKSVFSHSSKKSDSCCTIV